ncbi:O-antigen ligase family protein [Thermomonas flagellata]|uniref:O-antigen ligase family protein n=1 Tax=Thermomonas flagellata TaxID=2888524 RepID=UPI001F03366F|nr:O-antigen ligase family protein [Thermomonas flagellata]
MGAITTGRWGLGLHRLLPWALLGLLVAVWLGGGVSVDPSAADEVLELLALPVLVIAAAALLADGVHDRLARAGVVLALALVALPLLQLLPLPAGLWSLPAARQALAADLTAAGVAAPDLRWTLTPAATEQALWSTLPALALFLAALALDTPRLRLWMVRALLAILAGNVLFAFFQASLPEDSALRLYHSWGPNFGGLLVNANHHATALLIGLSLAVGRAVHARRRAAAGRAAPTAWLWPAGFALACVLLIPLTGSRAGMVLALPVLVAALWLTGAVDARRLRRSPRMLAAVLASLVLLALAAWSVAGWMQVDAVHELRGRIAQATLAIAATQQPWGSGVGSFVPVFAQGAPPDLLLDAYINHAHDEYVQWWLEAGWAGLLAMLAFAALMLAALRRLWRMRGQSGEAILAASCWVALLALLLHSTADFPLRTLTLMGTGALLAGLMLGALAACPDARPAAIARDAGHPGPLPSA